MQQKKRHRRPDLPYTPSDEFLRESMKQLREKGMDAPDEHLKHQILKAYRAKRAEILAAEAIQLYENS